MPRCPHQKSNTLGQCVRFGAPVFSLSRNLPHVFTRFEPTALVVPFDHLRMEDVEVVGGKNASLGEMISPPQRVWGASAGWISPPRHMPSASFLKVGGLDARITAKLDALNTDDVRALAEVGAEIRGLGDGAAVPGGTGRRRAHRRCTALDASGQGSFAVRSSATAEDLPDASFAGQQETFLNVVGIDDVLHKMREVFRFACTTTEPSAIASTRALCTAMLP